MSGTIKSTPGVPNLERALLITLSWGLAVFVATYVLIPIGIAFFLSFNGSDSASFPLTSYSLRWYADFFGSFRWRSGLINSLEIAFGTMVISIAFGVPAAWAFVRLNFRFKNTLYAILLTPLFMPGVVLGLGMAGMFGTVSFGSATLYGSKWLIILAHSLWAMPIVIMLMESNFRNVDFSIIEASSDLGGKPVRTFFEIVLPTVSSGVVFACVFAFLLSLNEFYMSLLLSDRSSLTLPVLMWLSLRSAGSPVLSVAAVVLEVTVFTAMSVAFIWYRFTTKFAGKSAN